jgi:hypothetical protein
MQEQPIQSVCNNVNHTGDNLRFGPGHGTWIGDFPPDYDPYNPYGPSRIIPIPQKLIPLGPSILPNTQPWPTIIPNPGLGGITLGATLAPNPWNVQFQSDKVVARCDVPGAVADSVNVEITNGSIQVNYRRFDTNGLCYPQVQCIGTDYDPKTAEATLELGVLTIVVKRFAEKATHKVTVTAK